MTGAALVALIFGLEPHRGPLIALGVAAVLSAAAAVVSMVRLAGERSLRRLDAPRARCVDFLTPT
ncbi:hypothetical protein BURKHO8Y_150122 [Burkholderia sp. 8Y]|uniref:hypothetical protein n=1 Tax=Burkholderia sp. 8Y TaxID=2653133 RepID=UPI0012F1A0AD|nr:hypothetical protein [Burkholderia sp. 8Y]VXB72358.1 hypothetical protein BURKHO8Y_150122 [Burkholderia sp. 8Y]